MRGIVSIVGTALLGAALAVAAAPAHAEQDAVQFFHNIDVTPDMPVHDAVCFFCSVHVDGKATGDIVVFFGNAHINGVAEHDVVDFFGNISAADNTRIEHDTVSIFGSIRLGEDASVGHDMVAVFGSVRRPGSVTVGGDHVTISGWLLYAPLLAIFGLILVLRERRVHRLRMAARGYPVPPRP
jgi:hypothetical protein